MKNYEELFNQEERELIDNCVRIGKFTDIPSLLDSRNMSFMSPDREKALEEYLRKFKTVITVEDSAVRREMDELIAKGELVLDSKEKEQFWQDKLDAERKAAEAKLRGESNEVQSEVVAQTESVVSVSPVSDGSLEDADADMTKNEIMEELKKKGINFKPAQPKSELFDLLEASN